MTVRRASDSLELDVGGRSVRVSNPSRILWPSVGFAKRDLVGYVRAVAAAVLPHLRGRPVTLGRFPEGIDGPGWYQTSCRGAPSWLRTYEVSNPGRRPQRYCVVDDEAGLVWAANLGALELHPLPWTVERPDVATHVVVDLDPGKPAGLADCCTVAVRLRDELDRRGLAAYAKTSGVKGLHVYARFEAPFDDAKRLAREVAAALAAADPALVTDVSTRSRRPGRVFVDWMQNDRNRSTAAPYSLRATREPGVSTPLTWDEVETGRLDPESLRFRPNDVVARIRRLGDPFAPLSS